MNKDEIKGKVRDIKGRIERQAGEWTGNKDAQREGVKDQAAGKAQNAFGKAKNAVRDVQRDLEGDRDEGNASDRDENAA